MQLDAYFSNTFSRYGSLDATLSITGVDVVALSVEKFDLTVIIILLVRCVLFVFTPCPNV